MKFIKPFLETKYKKTKEFSSGENFVVLAQYVQKRERKKGAIELRFYFAEKEAKVTVFSCHIFRYRVSQKKVFHKRQEKMHQKMKMTSQRAENLVHEQ